jgi:hypothetical protein
MGLRQTMQIIVEEAAKRALAADMQDAAKKGTDAAAAEVKKGGGAFDALGSSVMGTLKGIAAGIGAAFTVQAVVSFAKASIAEFQAVQRAWNEVRAAVTSSGGDFEAMRDRIAKVSDDIASRFAFDDDAVREGFTSLVRMTGDAEGALQDLEVAAQLARAGNMSVAQAAELLGRATETGVTRGLVPFVGVLDKSRDIMDQVREKLSGIESTISPMERGTAMLARGWDDLKLALGGALVAGAEGSTLFEHLEQTIADLTGWIQANQEEIAAWVKFGIDFLVAGAKTVGNTVKEIAAVWRFFNDTIASSKVLWGATQINFAQFLQKMLGLILTLQNGMLSLAEAMGLDGVADRVRTAMDRTSGYIGDLGTFIAHKSVEMKLAMGADDPQATKTTSLGGGFAANVTAGGDKARGDLTKTTEHGKAKVKELADATAAHMRSMADAYAGAGQAFDSKYTGSILAGKDRIVAAHADIQRASDVTTERLQQAQVSIQSAYIRTGDTATTAGSAIEQATREAIAAKAEELAAQEAVEGAWRGGEQYYVNQHVPAFLQGQSQMRQAAETSAKESSSSWLDSMGILNGALNNLANVAGGVFGQLLNGLSGVASGITAAAAGFKAFTDVTAGGFTGLIQKVAGLAGGISGVIGLISAIPGVLDAIGDIAGTIGGALGINRDKDPGRLRTNYELWQQAQAGDQAALDRLYQLSGRSGVRGDGAGGYVGWATSDAQDDAWRKYQLAGGTQPDRRTAATTTTTASAPAPTTLSSTPTSWSSPLSTGGTTQASPWKTFQTGGLNLTEGPAWLHAPELVLPPDLTQRILALAGGGRVMGPPMQSNADNRQLILGPIHVTGLPEDVPLRVVDAIEARLGNGFQREAALRGNALLPE